MQLSDTRLAALFLVSMAVLGFEIEVMRVFAVASWSNFGSMVISIALLGFGLAGTLLTLLQGRVRRSPDAWISSSAFALAPSMAACAHARAAGAVQPCPDRHGPVADLVDRGVLRHLRAAVFRRRPFHRHHVHDPLQPDARAVFLEHAGLRDRRAAGPRAHVPVPPGLPHLPARRDRAPPGTPLHACTGTRRGTGSPSEPWRQCSASFSCACEHLPRRAGSAASTCPTSSRRATHATSRTRPCSTTHTARSGSRGCSPARTSTSRPGLSDNAGVSLPHMPRNAFLGLFVDGNGPVGVMRKLAPDEEAYVDFLPMSAPYHVLSKPRVLLLRLGGGAGMHTALHNGAGSVWVVESNPDLLHMLRDVPFFRDYTGGVLAGPARARGKIGGAGIRGVDEGAIRPRRDRADRFDRALPGRRLFGGGELHLHGRGHPRLPEMPHTVRHTLHHSVGPAEPAAERTPAPVDRRGGAGPRGPWTAFEQAVRLQPPSLHCNGAGEERGLHTVRGLAASRDYCRRMSFEVDYAPGMRSPTGVPFPKILDAYRALYSPPTSQAAADAAAADIPLNPVRSLPRLAGLAFPGKAEGPVPRIRLRHPAGDRRQAVLLGLPEARQSSRICGTGGRDPRGMGIHPSPGDVRAVASLRRPRGPRPRRLAVPRAVQGASRDPGHHRCTTPASGSGT